MKEAMRRSARKVARALTPKRMTFGSDADAVRNPSSKKPRRGKKPLAKINEHDAQISTSKSSKDVEKGTPKISTFSVSSDFPPQKQSKWVKKFGR